MNRGLVLLLVVAALALVGGALFAWSQMSESKAEELASSGFTLHIDAIKHIDYAQDKVVHHYCKGIGDEVTECLLFDEHEPGARLIGVEVIVSSRIFEESVAEEEKAKWHYHETELPLVEPTLPDLSEEEAQEVVSAIKDTYGKVIIFWNPGEPAPTTPVSVTTPASVGFPAPR